MALKEFSLKELEHVNQGAAVEAFNAALQRAARDCTARPAEERVRKVTLQVELSPMQDPDGICDDLAVVVQVRDRIPDFATTPVRMAVRKRGQQLSLVFQDEEEHPDER